MGRIEKTVFISYRRTNIPWALAIYQHLTLHGYDVFFDYQSIKSGDFEQIIMQNIKGRAHFIVILTPSALERCNESGDWLRREIEFALDEKRNIIPLFFEGFDFGTPSIEKYLAGKLSLLKKYNGLNIPVDYFDAAMTKLRDDRLNTSLDTVLHPISTDVQGKNQEQQILANVIPTIKTKALTAQAYFETGYKFKGNPEDEIYYYSQAILLQSNYANAYANRGIAYQTQGNLTAAIDDYSRAISINPEQDKAYYNRARTYEHLGDLKSAIGDYDKAIHINPDYLMAYVNRGLIYYHQGDFVKAIEDYGEAIRIKPDSGDAYTKRGVAYAQQGENDKATDDFNLAIKYVYDEEKHLPYFNRGSLRQVQGDIKGAIEDFGEAIRINPEYADAYYVRGNMHKAQDDFSGAIADYREAVRINPKNAIVYYGLGSAYYNQGDFVSTIINLQKYLDLGEGRRRGDQEEIEQIIEGLKKKV